MDRRDILLVVKRSGEREEFDRQKTRAGIMRAGATEDEAEVVLGKLLPELHEGITTEEIYRRVRQLLDVHKAARYGLKKAILRLGPEGENFERFVARLFQKEGFETEVRLNLQGRCVCHEVDVVIKKDGKRSMVECKFHNSLGLKCSIQNALYTYARFLDLRQAHGFESAILATNTRFTSDVDRYARCVEMGLLGWRYPEEASLEKLIEKHLLYPTTVLDMKRSDQAVLLDSGMLLVEDIVEREPDVRRLLSSSSAEQLIVEARYLLHR